jgi:hypothetical protein
MREIVEAFADARAARRLRSPATAAGGSKPSG